MNSPSSGLQTAAGGISVVPRARVEIDTGIPSPTPAIPTAPPTGGIPSPTPAIHPAQKQPTVAPAAPDDPRFLTRIIDAIPDAIIATDSEFRIKAINAAAECMYGIQKTSATGQPVADTVEIDHGSPTAERDAWNQLLDRNQWSGRVRQRGSSGSSDWTEVLLTIALIRDDDLKIVGASFIARDLTALRRAERAATARETFAGAVLESLPGRTCVINRNGEVIAANQRYRVEGPTGAGQSTGPGEGQNYTTWVAEAVDDDTAFSINELLEGDRPDFRTEFATVRRRRRHWTELDAVPLGIESGGAVITHTDITSRKQAETTLTRRATHDPLTGLPNRVLLADRLSHALARTTRTGGFVGVLFCDLDGFRDVNNTHGHLAGDRLLVTVAKRLRAVCRSSDTVARVSGDEFVIILEDVTGESEIEEVARRVIDALTEPVVLEEGTARTGTSIGLVISPGVARAGARTVETLIRDADAAMYAAKEAGRARFAWFTPDMRERPRERPIFARAIGRLLRG